MAKWTWQKCASPNVIRLECETRNIAEYPIRVPSTGDILYDRPERIPKHIKAKVAKVFQETK